MVLLSIFVFGVNYIGAGHWLCDWFKQSIFFMLNMVVIGSLCTLYLQNVNNFC